MALARSLIIAASVLVSVRSARADELAGPRIAYGCPAPATWARLEDCFERHGWKFTLARSSAHAKLLSTNARSEVGLALYMQKPDGTWSLSGLFDTDVETYDVLRFEPITLGHTHGIRFDVGVRQSTTVSTDGQTTFEAVQMIKTVVFCSGLGRSCSEVVVDCDIFADGREYAAYHGAIQLVDHEVDVQGVSTAVRCAIPQKIELTWP